MLHHTQHIFRLVFFSAFGFLLAGAAVPADDIVLPEILAIELPKPGQTEIAPTEAPMTELLSSATARGLNVTHDRTRPLLIGGTLITWTAWEGEPHKSGMRRSKSAYVYVFPFGQTPVGVSGDDHATAGNHSAKVVRDADGKVHVAWLDGGRAGRGFRVLYRRGVQDFKNRKIHWETEPIRVSDAKLEAGNSYVALAGSENAIHFVWSGGGSARYRRLVRMATAWNFEPIRDSRARGAWHDNGPSIAARGDDEIHVLTPTGNYAVTSDSGLTWSVDAVPVPAGMTMKNPALDVDNKGNVHIVFTGAVRRPPKWSSSKPNRGYWQLRYIRRENGRWVDAQDALASFSRWREPTDESDMLSDWADIAADKRGNLHLVWHGTVNTRIYANDEAYYSGRSITAKGGWGAWSEPQALHPVNAHKGEFFSFAPSLSLDDTGNLVVAVVFFDTTRGGHVLDVDARLIRNAKVEGAAIPLSRLAGLPDAGGKSQSMSSWFPVANPRIFQRAEGDMWLDVLSTAVPPEHHKSPNYVIYQRFDLTKFVSKSGR
jgi:hypothetical protein